jgi:hypothetical protein
VNKTAKNRVFRRIQARGKGWVFSAIDFLPDLRHWEIRQSFVALEKEKKISRILPGLYYYPEYSQLLRKNVAPDIWRVAKALARKYDWKIFPEGNTALNYLALSTQIPARYNYISSGGHRLYKIGKMTLEFCHRTLRESTIRNKKTNLVVQALKSLGKVHADRDFLKLLSRRFSHADWVKIEKDAHKVSGWVLSAITKAKEFAQNGQNYRISG